MIDPAPLRADRAERLRTAMAEAGLDALVLTTAGSVRYATGTLPLHGDASLEAAWPCAAVVTPRSLTILGVEPEATPPGVAHAVLPRLPAAAAAAFAERVGGARRVGIERLPQALGATLARLLAPAALVPAEPAVLAARARKTAAEIALLREGLRASEAALAEVLPALVPGVREVEMGGRFLAAAARHGLAACHVEPLFCVLPRRAADAPWSFPGGVPYRELPDRRRFAAGDQVMIDTGMLHGGYLADVGWTWPCGGAPSGADRDLRARWDAITAAVLACCRPGATAADLHRAARAAAGGAVPPWPVPLYLAHGVGIGGVEPPFVGTDLGTAAEEQMELVPGMVLVLEPCVFEEGRGAYRAECTVAITAHGHERLSAPPP